MKTVMNKLRRMTRLDANATTNARDKSVFPDNAESDDQGEVVIDDRVVWGGLLWAMDAETTELFDARMKEVAKQVEQSSASTATIML